MTVNIYIESSIRAPARELNGVVGIVLQAGDTDNTKTLFGTVESVTKNHADAICLKNAVSRINGKCDKIIIHTSSNYVNQCLVHWRNKADLSEVKFAAEWQEIFKVLNQHEYEVVFKQSNEFRSWIQQECERRAEKHGF